MNVENSNSVDLQTGLLLRQSIPPRLMSEPAPTAKDVDDMLAAAVCAPDHGAIRPWRFHIIRGDSRLKLGKIFADAFGRDPQFFAFYRAMQAYEKALIGGETSLVLSPDSEFFKFFGKSAGPSLKKR